jgi:UDP-glucose 4-epimerase
MKHNRYGVLNWFIRLALDNETIPIFGDGRILRDFIYIDDLTNALMMCGLCDAAYGDLFNVGSGVAISFLDLMNKIIEIAGSGSYEYTPFTAERKALEPGDYWGDISKIKSIVGWEPRVPMEEGLQRTIAYYRAHRDHYWTRGEVWKE